jgi:hypothetical protein
MVVNNIVSDVVSVENNSTINYVISGQVALQQMKNADVLATRGRPKNIKKAGGWCRLGSRKEQKKQIICSNCGSHEHNKATCTTPPKDPSSQRAKGAKKNQATNKVCFYASF